MSYSVIDPYPMSYSTRIANRGDPRVPEAPPKPRFDFRGRDYESETGTWVAELPPKTAFACKRPGRSYPPMPATRGRFSWSILDALSGARFGSFHANHTAEAIIIAGEWAVSCGFDFGDVHVSHDC